jgi:predicted XRE-type DNA-binding protein
VANADPIPELKQQLAAQLVEAFKGLTTTEAYFACQIDTARVSDLRKGRLKRFSLEHLIRLLVMADRRVTIEVAQERKQLTQASRGSSAKRSSSAELAVGCRSETASVPGSSDP